MGPHQPERPTHALEGAPHALRGAARRGSRRQARRGADPHPGGTAPRRPRDRSEGSAQGIRRAPALRGPLFHAAARRHRRCDRPQRRRQDYADAPDHRPGAARRRAAARRRHGLLAYVDQSREALDDAKSVWEEISGGAEQIKVGDQWMNSRQYTASFNFKGSDQQKQVAKLSGGERNRLHLAKLLRAAGTCSCSTSRPTTSTSTRCARSRRRC